jgi:ATP-dependent Clp protease ATP-binding subunit ClpC
LFERFTERARQVVVLAQEEARTLKHNYIGTEHILLGLLREEDGIAARVLESLDITVEEVRAQVARIVGQGDEVTTSQIPFTPRAKKVLELALREGLALGHNYIGTEHVLLGLVSEGEGVASRVLLDFGVGAETVREAVADALSGVGRQENYAPSSPPVAEEVGAEIERLGEEKKRAIEERRFEDAADVRVRWRRLVNAARDLERAWRDEPEMVPRPLELHSPRGVRMPMPHIGRMPRRVSSYSEPPRFGIGAALVVGWALFAGALGIGILVGWAIWG